MQRSEDIVIRMLENVQQQTTKLFILKTVSAGTQIYMDEYTIHNRLDEWVFQHKAVNHSVGKYDRDEDGDGFCEVHSNSIEGFWSLLRLWLQPYRGIYKAKLLLYSRFFGFVYNVKKPRI